jgi:hypothetical protein
MINWSAIDHRSLAGRLLRAPMRMIPAGAVMSIRRGPARGMKWIAGSAIHGCWLGTDELDKQMAFRFVRPYMKNPPQEHRSKGIQTATCHYKLAGAA